MKLQKLQDIINRTEFNLLMKYENIEFERNFQLKRNERSADEPTTSTSSTLACAQSRTEKSQNNIQVNMVTVDFNWMCISEKKFGFQIYQYNLNL